MKMALMKLRPHCTSRNLVVFSFLFFIFCVSANAQKCFDYEPNGRVVSLAGTLRSQIFAGPPNYESIRRGDRKETALILSFTKPACTNGDAYFDAETNIREMQLVVVREADWKTVRRLIGKRAIVTGTRFHANTGHHRTKVLITLNNIRGAKGR
jgi:Domain of unknown function (DUF4431)